MAERGESSVSRGDATLYDDIVVLDVSSSIRGMHCAKMFGDYGAEVILVEPVGGSAARQVGPFAAGREDRETSLHFMHHNRNKKSVALNLHTERGQELLRELARGADLLIEDWPVGTLEALGLGFTQLHALNPRLVVCSITGFGQSGPYAGYKTSNIVEDAMGGLMGITGPADRPPTMTGAQQAEHITAMHAAYACAAALLYRELHDEGQHIDVSAQDCVASVLENAIEQYTYTGVVRKRSGSRHGTAWPCTVFPCKDGYIGMCCTQGKEVRAAALLSEDFALAEDPVLENTFERRSRADEFEPRLVAGYMKYGKSELFHKGQTLGCPIGMTSDARDLATDAHLNEIGFFGEFAHPVIGPYKDIAAPVYMTATPGVMRSAAPLLGQHTSEVLSRLNLSEAELATLSADGII
ncbi:MAG TPA: CoA transferase [Ktedonobacteraceae bacterium]|nr:CoA transferase [Ktedonobacteraceae bacterium]